MDIKTLKAVEHRGCKIYIRNFHTTFEYLALVHGQLYTAHIVAMPSFGSWFRKEPYSEKQLTDVCTYLLTMAQTTVDYLLDEQKPKTP